MSLCRRRFSAICKKAEQGIRNRSVINIKTKKQGALSRESQRICFIRIS